MLLTNNSGREELRRRRCEKLRRHREEPRHHREELRRRRREELSAILLDKLLKRCVLPCILTPLPVVFEQMPYNHDEQHMRVNGFIEQMPYNHGDQHMYIDGFIEELPLFDPDTCMDSNYHTVLQNEASFGKKSMGTFGVGPCIAIAGLDRQNGICFVAHFDASTDIRRSLGGLIGRLQYSYQDLSLNFDVVIVGGCSESDVVNISTISTFLRESWITEYMKINFVGRNCMYDHHYDSHGTRSIGVDIEKNEFCTVEPLKVIPDFDMRMKRVEYSIMFSCGSKRSVCFV